MSKIRTKSKVALGAAALLTASLVAALPLAAEERSSQRNEVSPFGHGMHAPPPPAAPSSYEDTAPPLFTDVGGHSWKISTADPAAQAFFDQGIRLSYAFNHAEAQRAFRQAQRLDPSCAMCFWGEALVLGPNINAPMDPAANAPALAALERAAGLAGGASAKEAALIAGLQKRYSADAKADRAALDKAWAEALGDIAARFPDDLDVTTLHAEAMMDTQPWDYWADGGRTPKGDAAAMVAALERVLARDPGHPGAVHLYIHAVEASDRPERAEPHADRLAALMPGAGHIVHMPSHIYYRIGRYIDALEQNKKAVAVDEAYIGATQATGFYPAAYYPHNMHFALAAAQMAGDAKTALEMSQKLSSIVTAEMASAVPLAQPVMAAPFFAHAQFGSPDAVLALTVADNAPPYVKAMWRYARGVALAKAGRTDDAAAEAAAIGALRRDADFTNLIAQGIPGPQVLELAEEIVAARIAQARGDAPGAAAAFAKAAALQDALAYMEPPYWYYPVHQSLGAALLQAGRTDDAEAAFREALKRSPNNGWAIYGLVELAKARGDTMAERDAEARLARSWVGDRGVLELKNL
jgi:tetratricopeptide (TPR) repeat protein